LGGAISMNQGHDHDWRKLYPFASRRLQLDGPRMHYVDEGPRDAAPYLFVHGNPTWSFYWRRLIEALRSRHRCLALDHIGCGMSDKPRQYPYTLAQHTANLQALIERLELHDITLCVHDWGGPIGLGAAVAQPERCHRLVVFNTGAFPPPYAPLRIRACRFPLAGRHAILKHNAFVRSSLWMATEKPERFTPPVKAGYLAPYLYPGLRRATWEFVRDIPLTRGHPTHHVLANLEQELPRLAARPIDLIWGMKDWCFTDVCLERFTQVWPRARVHKMADAGHYVVEDAWERILPLLAEDVESDG